MKRFRYEKKGKMYLQGTVKKRKMSIFLLEKWVGLGIYNMEKDIVD